MTTETGQLECKGIVCGDMILFITVGFGTVGDAAFSIISYGYGSTRFETLKHNFLINAFSYLKIYQLSRWLFKRWSNAGYELKLWTGRKDV